MTTIDLDSIHLESGAHQPGTGYCIEELVAALAGEDFSDRPQCVSPVIAAYCRGLNDRLPDAERQRLKAYAVRQIGTRGDAALEQRRMYVCADYAVRVFAPLALDARGLSEQATSLRNLAPIVDRASALTGRDAATAAATAAAYAADDDAATAAATAAAYAANAALPAVIDAAFALLDALIDCGSEVSA